MQTKDIVETMREELDEGAELLRPHYPECEDDETLREWAIYWRPFRYQEGRWPTAEEIEAEKARVEAEKAKARKLETETV